MQILQGPFKPVAPKVGCTDLWRAVGLPRGGPKGQGVAGSVGRGPLRGRCSLIYD
jgi:hypothetical protein